MNYYVACLILFAVVFIVVFLVYNLFIYKRQLKKREYMDIVELKYLYVKFKLDHTKISYKRVLRISSAINAFIIAITSLVLIMIDVSFIWQIILAFAILMALIYSLYELFGRVLLKKGYGKK